MTPFTPLVHENAVCCAVHGVCTCERYMDLAVEPVTSAVLGSRSWTEPALMKLISPESVVTTDQTKCPKSGQIKSPAQRSNTKGVQVLFCSEVKQISGQTGTQVLPADLKVFSKTNWITLYIMWCSQGVMNVCRYILSASETRTTTFFTVRVTEDSN